MKIPKSFEVFASKINVNFDSERLSYVNALGDCSYTEGQISLCDKYKGEELTESCILDTFYHEKVHIILDSMGEHSLSENEKFVEVFARLLRQSDKTAIY